MRLPVVFSSLTKRCASTLEPGCLDYRNPIGFPALVQQKAQRTQYRYIYTLYRGPLDGNPCGGESSNIYICVMVALPAMHACTQQPRRNNTVGQSESSAAKSELQKIMRKKPRSCCHVYTDIQTAMALSIISARQFRRNGIPLKSAKITRNAGMHSTIFRVALCEHVIETSMRTGGWNTRENKRLSAGGCKTFFFFLR